MANRTDVLGPSWVESLSFILKGTTVEVTTLLPPSLDTSIPEDVTKAIHRIGQPGEGDEEIYSWLQCKLRTRAEMVLRKFARLSGTVDADQLVNEFMIRLITNIGAEDVRNRRHFFGLACNNFNWIMQGMARQISRRQVVPLPNDLTSRSFDVDLFISLLDFMDDELTEDERQLINMRLILEFRWKSIEAILGIPKATLSDRLKKLITRMESELNVTWEDSDAD